MSKRFIDAIELATELGVSEETIARWVKAGQFPAPLRLGLRRYVWLRTEYEAHIDERSAERSRGEPTSQTQQNPPVLFSRAVAADGKTFSNSSTDEV